MGGLRNRVVGRLVSSTCFQMNRRKTLGEDVMDTPLRRCLSTLDITLLGYHFYHNVNRRLIIIKQSLRYRPYGRRWYLCPNRNCGT